MFLRVFFFLSCSWAAMAGAQVVAPRVTEAPPLPVLVGSPEAVFVVPLLLEIDAAGEVASIGLEASVDTDVATAAVSYAEALHFEPALEDGVPRPARVRFEVRVARRAPAATEPSRADATLDDEPETLEGFGATAEVDVGVVDRPDAATSEMRLPVRALRDVPRYHAEQWLTLVPGAVLGSHGGEGKASNLYLRGFDAGEGQDLEVRVEGIPINEPSNAHEHGYADTYFLVPELVREVTVLPGPFDPAQGDFALAGTLDYRLGLGTRGVRVLGGYGSYRRRRAMIAWSSGGESDDFVAFEVQAGRGFGANRSHRLFRGLTRIGGGDERLGWSLLAGTHALDFDSAGVVRADAVEAGALPCGSSRDQQRFCTHDATQGGAAQRHLVSANVRWQRPGQRFESRFWGQLRRSRFRDDYTFFLVDPRGDALDQQSEAFTIGLRADYVAQTTWRTRPQQLELGVLARHDRGDVRTWRLRAGTRTPYDTVFDSALATTQAGAYATGVLRVPRVTLRAGARIAAFAVSTRDRNLPSVDREGERVPMESADAYGVAVLPRGTLNVALSEAEASQLDWTTSVGRGARSSDAQALSDGETAPFARSISAETGLRSRARLGRVLAFDGRLGAFWTRVGQDLLFDPEAGRNVPVGPTQRYGAYVSAQLVVPSWVEMLASFAWSEAHLAPDGAGAFELLRGPRLPFVPRFVGRLDLALRRRVRIRRERITIGAALGGTVVGRKPLPLGELSQPIAVLDGSARVAWRFAELALLVRNVTGTRYRQLELHYESRLDPDDPLSSLRAARHFAAGAPREVLVQLTLHFDPNGLVDDDRDTARAEAAPNRDEAADEVWRNTSRGVEDDVDEAEDRRDARDSDSAAPSRPAANEPSANEPSANAANEPAANAANEPPANGPAANASSTNASSTNAPGTNAPRAEARRDDSPEASRLPR
ncbi:MAG: TonB-dependent receptor [Sandaracinus sp.]|nr:TonB-dependent receptor [Sandaracinus sp.]MCB9613019.1 TonB-dependent receptor [Sandaracinus sp.]